MKTTTEEAKDVIYDVVGEILATIIIILVLGYPIMLLWNSTLPNIITGFNPISYWQACGIITLTRMLIGKRTGN